MGEVDVISGDTTEDGDRAVLGLPGVWGDVFVAMERREEGVLAGEETLLRVAEVGVRAVCVGVRLLLVGETIFDVDLIVIRFSFDLIGVRR